MMSPDFPIIDLHCHFGGSTRPQKSYDILHRRGYDFFYSQEEFLKIVTGFRSGREGFFEAASILNWCLIDEACLREIIEDLIKRATVQDVKILELSFSPRPYRLLKPPTAGVREYTEALLVAVGDFTQGKDIAVGITMLIEPHYHLAREFSETNGDIRDFILEYRQNLTGVDLCSLDVIEDDSELWLKLPSLCEAVKGSGLHLSAHAGEFTGGRPILKAIELGVERIGHGIRTIDDEKIVIQIIENDITLEVCPISNYRTGAVAAGDEHPLLRLLRAGVKVTINSDDQGVQNSTWRDDYDFSMRTIGLSEGDIRKCLRNSFDASFLGPERKNIYRDLFCYRPSLLPS